MAPPPELQIEATSILHVGTWGNSGMTASGTLKFTSHVADMPAALPGGYQGNYVVKYTTKRHCIYRYDTNHYTAVNTIWIGEGLVIGSEWTPASYDIDDTSNDRSWSENFGSSFAALMPGHTLNGVEFWFEVEAQIVRSNNYDIGYALHALSEVQAEDSITI